ncbi:MAG TPA: hypothetical protein VNK23_14285 [Candidatus Dormibacteraeota bacterium]|nr:hypothetical protein [Candidatus Dormibacteraeota bacterium]
MNFIEIAAAKVAASFVEKQKASFYRIRGHKRMAGPEIATVTEGARAVRALKFDSVAAPA